MRRQRNNPVRRVALRNKVRELPNYLKIAKRLMFDARRLMNRNNVQGEDKNIRQRWKRTLLLSRPTINSCLQVHERGKYSRSFEYNSSRTVFFHSRCLALAAARVVTSPD